MNGNANPVPPGARGNAGRLARGRFWLPSATRARSCSSTARPWPAILVPRARIASDLTVAGNTVSAQGPAASATVLAEFPSTDPPSPRSGTSPDMLRYEPGLPPPPPGPPGVPARRVRQRSTAQHRPEPVVRAGRRAHRLATRRRVPGRRTTLEFLPSLWVFGDNRRLRGRDPRDRTHVPDRGAPDARLRPEPLGVARRHLGLRAARPPSTATQGQELDNLRASGTRSATTSTTTSRPDVRLPVDGQRPR